MLITVLLSTLSCASLCFIFYLMFKNWYKDKKRGVKPEVTYKTSYRILERDGKFTPQVRYPRINTWYPLGKFDYVLSLEKAQEIIDERIEAEKQLNKPTIIHSYPVQNSPDV